ncbi:gamma-tubulin complex, DGRIP91/SPC98 component [Crassisporium funariophilum]|nr:gamma-tubulin complex, DGRIP91/SPC98 component [Crassisporium funariophilum]
MSGASPLLDALVYTYVPISRTNQTLKNELVAHCQDILMSHIGHKTETDIAQLTDLVKRRLLQLSPSGTSASRFSNLVIRLLDQPVLSRKQEAILFLFTLSATTARRAPTIQISTLANPRPSRTQTNLSSPSNQGDRGPCKAELLREYRTQQGVPHMSEYLLLRDTLYLMQGISGKYVRFASSHEDEKRIVFGNDVKTLIAPPTQALIHRLAELGYLYSRVEGFVREREGAIGVGMIEQSLCHHLQTQLTEYYRLIAILETQMSSSTPCDDSSSGETDRKQETGLSLRRLDVWVNEWRLRMRMMSVCVEGARGSHGGALVNLIHSYTDNGDPFVRKFTDELLEEVSRPFFATLHKWLFSGELYDPFKEFFVSVDSTLGHIAYVHPSSMPGGINHLSDDGGLAGFNADVDDASGLQENSSKLWETKYSFRKDMLPMFVGESFGRKIFSTGKSLNFIRYSCHDSDWVVTREKMSNTGGALQYSDIGGLERSIDAAYQIASHRLFEVFIEKFKLLDHLSALKGFLLLSHGDFADQLMETLGPSLAKPANTLYRHNLTANLETAIRSSNAQHGPADVLRRLDARMLEYSHGEIGWDVFTLEYKVDPPIDTVLDPEAMEKYLKLFKHLWQAKRIEMALNKGWLRVTGGAHAFLRLPELEPEWHRIRLVTAEMIHFIRQLEAFSRLEVIECSWNVLIDFLNKKEGDLDALIDSHRAYLDRMTKKILLWNSKPGKEDMLLRQLTEIFNCILQFRDATDNFYNYCLTESARRDQELDANRGVYTGNPRDNQEHNRAALPGLLSRLKDYGSAFSDKLQTMVQHLQVHPDLDCRFLGIRLSFSDFYRSKKDQQPMTATTSSHSQQPK